MSLFKNVFICHVKWNLFSPLLLSLKCNYVINVNADGMKWNKILNICSFMLTLDIFKDGNFYRKLYFIVVSDKFKPDAFYNSSVFGLNFRCNDLDFVLHGQETRRGAVYSLSG